jgi:hypothetical protein
MAVWRARSTPKEARANERVSTGDRTKRLKRREPSSTATKVPKIGLFFVVSDKPRVEGIPWAESPSVSGFRTYGVDHPDYWRRLQDLGAAPRELTYEDCPRGRVNYMDATGGFTLFADKCIINRKPLVRRIMALSACPRTRGWSRTATTNARCAWASCRPGNRKARTGTSDAVGIPRARPRLRARRNQLMASAGLTASTLDPKRFTILRAKPTDKPGASFESYLVQVFRVLPPSVMDRHYGD